jgi:pSer/pThr/pTyr-binding forkhead associated (FHA) protein
MSENEKKFVVVVSNSGKTQRFELPKTHFSIGRSTQADLKLEITGISRQHVEIKYENNQFHIMDMGSLNGTFVNGQKISPKKWAALRESDDLRIGMPPVILSLNTYDAASLNTNLPTEIDDMESSLNLLGAAVFKDITKSATLTQGTLNPTETKSPPNNASPAFVSPPPPIRHTNELELRQLQIDLDNIKNEVSRNSRLNKQISEMKDRAQTEFNKLNEDLEKLKADFSEKSKDFNYQIETKSRELSQTIETKTAQIDSLKSECDSIALAREQLSQELEKTRDQLRDLNEQLEKVKRQKEVEEEVLLTKITKQTEAETEKSAALKVLKETIERKQELDQNLRILNQEKQDLQTTIESNIRSVDQLKKEISENQRLSGETRDELKTLQSSLEDLRVSDRKRKADLEAFEAEHKVRVLKIEGHNESLLTQRKSFEREIESHELRLKDLKNQEQTTIQSTSHLHSEAEKLKLTLESHQKATAVELKNIEIHRIEKRNIQEEIERLEQEIREQRLQSKKERDATTQELESIRQEVISRAHDEKERLIKEAETSAIRLQEESRTLESQSKKKLETELTEMKFRASEEIRLMREEEERRTELSRAKEKQALDFGLEQVFLTNVELIKKSNFSEPTVAQALKEIQSAAKRIMKLENQTFQELNIMPHLQSHVPFNPNAVKNEKEFWKRLGTRMAIGVAIFILLVFTPFLNFSKNQIKRMLASDQSASEVFAKRFTEAKLNKPKYNPVQSRDFRNTYTDNFLFLEGYSILKTEPEIERKWVLELDTLFKGPLNLGDRVVADFIPAEAMFLSELGEIRRSMTPENAEESISKMRALEEQKVAKLQEILKGFENYFRVREFEKEFYQKFVNDMK